MVCVTVDSTRLLPLLAIPILKAGVITGSNQENVEIALLL